MKSIGRYQLIEELGRGSFATVYRALDTKLAREVALKVLNPLLGNDPEFTEQFRREARAAARLNHTHIVTIYDFDETGGRHFIAMELLAGRDLRRFIQEEGPLPFELAVDIVDQLAEALDYAHRQGLVHRDIKAANVMIENGGRAVLTDFGLAKAIAGSMYAQSLGGSLGIAGTVEYMAPEQAEGEAATPRSDLYALGVLAYEMLTGWVPFRAESPLVVMRMHADKPPPDPAELRPDLPPAMRAALLKVLSKDPAGRQENALAFAAELRQSVIDNRQTEITLTLAPGVTMTLVRVPAGPFLMGSDKEKDEDADDDELPQHEVYLEEYWIGKTPVTNAQYRAFVQAAGHRAPDHWKNEKIPKGKENHPVVHVDWHDALAFCQWASQVTGEPITLPSEAQWEKAARGAPPSVPPAFGGENWGGEALPLGRRTAG